MGGGGKVLSQKMHLLHFKHVEWQNVILSLTWMQMQLEDSKFCVRFVFKYGPLNVFLTGFKVTLCVRLSFYVVFTATVKKPM